MMGFISLFHGLYIQKSTMPHTYQLGALPDELGSTPPKLTNKLLLKASEIQVRRPICFKTEKTKRKCSTKLKKQHLLCSFQLEIFHDSVQELLSTNHHMHAMPNQQHRKNCCPTVVITTYWMRSEVQRKCFKRMLQLNCSIKSFLLAGKVTLCFGHVVPFNLRAKYRQNKQPCVQEKSDGKENKGSI